MRILAGLFLVGVGLLWWLSSVTINTTTVQQQMVSYQIAQSGLMVVLMGVVVLSGGKREDRQG